VDTRNGCMDLHLESVRAMPKYPVYRDLIPSAPPPITATEALESNMHRIISSLQWEERVDPMEIAKRVSDIVKVPVETALVAVKAKAQEKWLEKCERVILTMHRKATMAEDEDQLMAMLEEYDEQMLAAMRSHPALK